MCQILSLWPLLTRLCKVGRAAGVGVNDTTKQLSHCLHHRLRGPGVRQHARGRAMHAARVLMMMMMMICSAVHAATTRATSATSAPHDSLAQGGDRAWLGLSSGSLAASSSRGCWGRGR